jgi:hypothetical protein
VPRAIILGLVILKLLVEHNSHKTYNITNHHHFYFGGGEVSPVSHPEYNSPIPVILFTPLFLSPYDRRSDFE